MQLKMKKEKLSLDSEHRTMKNFVFLTGLPGVGKSTIGADYSIETNRKSIEDIVKEIAKIIKKE